MGKNPALATLAANIKQGIENRLKDLHTSMPGIIESFDPLTQLASVQPAIKRIFVNRDEEKEILVPENIGVLINVPVVFPRGGGFSLTFPVTKGDECLLVFCERSIDNWHETGEINRPAARRFHSLSDATAFVGMSSKVNKIPEYDELNTQLKKDDGSVSITLLTDGNIKIDADTKVTLTAPDTDIIGKVNITGDTKVTGNFEVTGDTTLGAVVTSNGVDISATHTHTGSPTAPSGPVSPTGVPV